MKIRIIIWTVVLAVIALLLHQNRDFYMGEQTLSLNLFFAHWETPPVTNATQVLLAFLAGLVLASISLYHERFKMRRQLKKLTIAFQSCAQQVTDGATECSASGSRLFKLPGILKKRGTEADRATLGKEQLTANTETDSTAP